jgi:hypothetical protein
LGAGSLLQAPKIEKSTQSVILEERMMDPVKFGRKRKLSDYQRAEAVKRRNAGETLAAIAKSYGVAISMISRL